MGGYELLEDPKNLSLLRLIEIFDGPPALTACMMKESSKCQIDQSCPQRPNWQIVHQKIAHILSDISLFELIVTPTPKLVRVF